MKNDKLRFGVSYCPFAKSGDVDMAYWERDFQTMQKLNFNTLRCFVAWDRIERQEGQCDFSKTDYIFELAEKYDIDVILNIGGVFDCYGGIYPPRWLIYDYNCQHIIEDPATAYVPFGAFRLLCPDDPVFTQKAQEFTVKAIKRYKNQPRLCGWNVWNEAALDHMCYCPVTLEKFRSWLKSRYNNDLDKLNSKWGTEFPVDFRNWEMVEPGLGAGFRAGGHVARLDWMRFNREKVGDWVRGVNKLVKKLDPSERPTTSNIVVHAVGATDGRKLNIPDLWDQNHDLDVAGFSFYAHKLKPSDCAYALSSVRGSSAAPDKSFWVLETSAGHEFNPELYPGDCFDREVRLATHWQSVLHGCKTILLWKFGGRVTDNQTDYYNLTGWDGAVTERAEVNAAFFKVLQKNELLFLDKSYHADTAILFSPDALIFNTVDNAMNSFDKALQSRLGAYQLLRDLRIQTDVISDTQVKEGKLANYRALIIPWCDVMDQELAEWINRFIAEGGTVIADRCLNLKDENSRIHGQAPGHGMKTVFGGYINDMVLTATDEGVKTAEGSIPVTCHRHSIIHPHSEATVIGSYKNGKAAAIASKHGKGGTLWFGFDLFHDYRHKPCQVSSALVRKELEKAGIITAFAIEGEADGVECGVLTGDDGSNVYFLLNMTSATRQFSLSLSGVEKELSDLLSDYRYTEASKVTLIPWQVMILH